MTVPPGSATGARPPCLLALDTATRTSVVALGDGPSVAGRSVLPAGHRHGATLLVQIDAVLEQAGHAIAGVDAVVVGTGPGSFTGLRVGLATAKTIAYARSLPLLGVASSVALRAAAVAVGAPADAVVVLPAGARDHYLAAVGEDARLVPPGDLVAALDDRPALTIDMATEPLGEEAATWGKAALEGLPEALLALAAARLAADELDDIEQLVPAYVALPRGVARAAEELGWSPDLR